MKRLIIIIFLLSSLFCSAQFLTAKEQKNILFTSALTMVSGAFDGTTEFLQYRYTGTSQFWQPDISWRNKWKNGDPLQGEKFWQSSRALVFVTDGYHLTRMGRNLFAMTAIVVNIGDGKKQWYKYVIQFCVNYVAYTAGFSLMYDLILSK